MKLINFVKQCKRVLKIATKPTKEEYILTIKITTIGIFALGLIGFSVYLIFNFFGV